MIMWVNSFWKISFHSLLNSLAWQSGSAIFVLLMKPKFDDTYQHKGLRRQLIQLLREKGITDEAVLEAMNNIPRHFFLDSAFDKIAYEDRAFPIGEGQTIS